MFNSKNIKRIILLIITFCILLSVKSFAVVSQTKDFFVNDYAGVLTEETKNYIIQTNAELQQKTGAQIVVVTVKSLEGQSIEEYATELFRKFGIGDSQKNNGVLLNGIYSREISNKYGKPIINGKSEYTLSEEEEEALYNAINNSN